jgi:hypothetical protein
LQPTPIADFHQVRLTGNYVTQRKELLTQLSIDLNPPANLNAQLVRAATVKDTNEPPLALITDERIGTLHHAETQL